MPSDQESTVTTHSGGQSSCSPAKHRWLLTYRDVRAVHDWAADNPHVTGHYRRPGSWRHAAQSLCRCHNETVNVYSHLLGAIAFVWLLASVLWAADHLPASRLLSVLPGPPTLVEHGLHTPALYRAVAASDAELSRRLQDAQELTPLELKVRELQQTLQRTWRDATDPARLQAMQADMDAAVAALRKRANRAEASVELSLGAVKDALTQAWEVVREPPSSVHDSVDELETQLGAGQWRELLAEFKYELHQGPTPGHVPKWPLAMFIACAVICLTGSALFHLMFISSRATWEVLSRVDYTGIIVLICGSTEAAVYYMLYNHPPLRVLHMTTVAISNALVLAVVLAPTLQHKPVLRSLAFIGVSGVGAVALFHAMMLPDSNFLAFKEAVRWLAWEGVFYLSGAVLYMFRFPERIMPGRVNLVGASHQLFHIAVCLGAWAHYRAVAGYVHAMEAGLTAWTGFQV